jgi:SAM-dependent methyltransferase
MKTISASIYDYPRYYDLVYGSDWKAEFDFLQACFAKHARRPLRRLFEPACGTGRLLVKMAQAGYAVAGNDLNAQAVDYCNARLRRAGFRPTAMHGDMADFRLTRNVDAAFNTISSFRHLATHMAAQAHLQCMADALGRGGLYVLGLQLTPDTSPGCAAESWAARRGNLCVLTHLQSLGLDRRRRQERVRLTCDVYTPTDSFRLANETLFRCYSARQFRDLLRCVPEFEVAAAYDFAYDVDRPIRVGAATEDVVFVLRKK